MPEKDLTAKLEAIFCGFVFCLYYDCNSKKIVADAYSIWKEHKSNVLLSIHDKHDKGTSRTRVELKKIEK